MAVHDISEYPTVMRRFARGTLAFSAVLLRSIGTEVSRNVISGTPVDTGLARSNWLASINVARPGTRPTVGRGPATQIAEASSVARAVRPDDAFYLSNNIHHIGELNRNKSDQAPSKFIQSEMARGIAQGIVQAGTIARQVRRRG